MVKVLYVRRKQDKISGRVSIIDYKNILNKPEYDFRNKNEYLGKRSMKWVLQKCPVILTK